MPESGRRRDSRQRQSRAVIQRGYTASGPRREYERTAYQRGYAEPGRPSGPRTGGQSSRTVHRTASNGGKRAMPSHGPRIARRMRRRRRIVLSVLFLAVLVFVGVRLIFVPPVQKPEASDASVRLQSPELIQVRPLPPPSPLETHEPTAAPEPDVEAPVIAASDSRNHTRRKKDFYTFLVAGVDDGNGGSDTMILAALDAKNGAINGVSLPRDTKAIVSGEEHKLNYAYNVGGMKLLSSTVSRQMGIPIDYTVEVNLEGFAALVDAIGGVDFEVPIDMNYDDPKQNLVIQFKAGMQHLNGEDAMRVVRFRHNWDGSGYGDEDLGRMRTQQNFLKTVAKKILRVSNLKNLNRFAEIFEEYVETDLTVRNLAWLGREAISIGADGVEFCTLPGTWKYPYIYADRKAVLDLVNEKLNPYVENRTADDLHLAR